MKEHRIALGDRVKDSLTGFEGIAICRMEWLHGCERIAVQSEKLKEDGSVLDDRAFDEAQLEIVEAGAKAVVKRNLQRPPGGPDRNEQRGARARDPRADGRR